MTNINRLSPNLTNSEGCQDRENISSHGIEQVLLEYTGLGTTGVILVQSVTYHDKGSHKRLLHIYSSDGFDARSHNLVYVSMLRIDQS